ncbi:hypothetical protein IV500_04765 [Paeniglutamicibacter antarcticus]|uniref:Uncharacterized protein n=1 Tax=Arthrobacter terrae TaxID=2935737 RepID=A0A931G4S3_9MICC|nr:hypothetical protein [Arthrobacter terrae]MBG0738730.1 hypothetical protein [Arthrobacter terrae]
MPGKNSALSVSRREWQRLLIDSWGKENEPGGEPWFGAGRFVQHLTPGIFAHVGFCGRETGDTSSNPIRTLIGITCPGCTRVAKQIRRRLDAENRAAAASGHPDRS